MKILVLTPGIYPDRHSGIPKLVFYLARELRRRGHEIAILTRRYAPSYPEEEIIEGMQVHRLPIPHEGSAFHPFWPLATVFQSARGQRRLKRLHPDVDLVWVHNPWWLLFSNPKKLWPQARIVYDFHSDAMTELAQNHNGAWTARLAGRLFDASAIRGMRKADLVSVHSRFTREICASLLGNHGAPPLAVVPGGADPELYRPAGPDEKSELKRRLGLPLDRPVFLTARGLKRRTGVDKLIEAAFLLKEGRIPFFLLVVGRGGMKPLIEKKIRDLDLESSVRLTGDLSEEELAAAYRASDVFVLPTQGAEGFGLATVEALASGLVVLGTGNSATPEILRLYHPDWIIPGHTPEAISGAMAAYCRNPEKFSLPVETIREITLRHFTWPVAADRFLEATK
jgi:glycosyltransferase involved in cell wall biosynthesis